MKTFELSDEQLVALMRWESEHDRMCSLYDDGTKPISKMGAIGGRATYCFTPTSLGMIAIFKCACGGELNLTEYHVW